MSIWVKYRELHGGKIVTFWKRKSSHQAAERETREWNQWDNPYEHLSISKVQNKKPIGIRKTKYRGIYR